MSRSNHIASSSLSFHFVQPVKLDRSNYLVWKAQVRTSIIANGLESFINGENCWMLSSMVDNVLIMVINCETSLELWEMLAEIFMSQSKASLAIGGNPVTSNELIMHLLTGLDDNYESLVTNILTRLEKEKLTVEEKNVGAGNSGAYDNNQNRSTGLGKDVVCQICFIPGHVAYKCKHRFNQGFIPRNRGFDAFRPRGGGVMNPQGVFDFQGANGAYNGVPTANMYVGNIGIPHNVPPSAQLANYSSVADPAWYLGSEATNHIAQDAGILSKYSTYHVFEKLHVGNGMGLPIHNVGSVAIKTLSAKPIYLNNVLHVPTITKNLISVSKLLADNNVFIEFYNHVCFVKDKNSRITLLKGIARGVTKTNTGLHLSQSKYIVDLLNKVNMQDCTPRSTPMAANVPLTKTDSEFFADATLYRSTIGTLQYATLTRPKIAFPVNKLSQFLAAPKNNHWQACKRILRYLKGTMHMGLQYSNQGPLHIDCFSDADWAADRDDRKSIARYCVYFGPNLISWCSKKQEVVSKSSTKSEYQALAMAASEVFWLKSLLTEISISLVSTPVIWCDNQSAAALASNPKFHSRTKHIELDVHFLREKVANKSFQVSYVPSSDNSADILTKALAYHPFHYLRDKLTLTSLG
ncbi:reverse transcriptase Ty1/copia-type domain-containing protein [Citrus sinensis]|uniref:Reverse transcriptase Ty1/copia-type domain-containing protein n=2 Tax=Citrus sinensis TaxID=2711 RepID=A0ACB8LA64_CITSI|nr:reverse transcriptase Ty1/copia-type domain-containing protein [Citrus sinensis]KAH9770205.1 reverse transcriptase Ty1/copia-type domain-containing protein [Citrus sinensis]